MFLSVATAIQKRDRQKEASRRSAISPRSTPLPEFPSRNFLAYSPVSRLVIEVSSLRRPRQVTKRKIRDRDVRSESARGSLVRPSVDSRYSARISSSHRGPGRGLDNRDNSEPLLRVSRYVTSETWTPGQVQRCGPRKPGVREKWPRDHKYSAATARPRTSWLGK